MNVERKENRIIAEGEFIEAVVGSPSCRISARELACLWTMLDLNIVKKNTCS